MKIVSVSSGKGGVGKTTVTCNLALAIAEQNKRVVIIDGDLGLANVDIHFGVHPQAHLGDVLKGQPMQQCITPILKNIDLIAGGSGLTELTHLNAFQRRELIAQVQDMQFNYDYAIIDNSSGIYEHVLHLNAIADDCLVVLTQDPSSFADAYYNLADFYYSLGNKNLAIANFQKVIALNKDISNKLVAKGVISLEQGATAKAISLFNQAAQTSPQVPDIYRYRGLAYQRQGNNALAVKDWRKASQGYRQFNAQKDYDMVRGWLKQLGTS